MSDISIRPMLCKTFDPAKHPFPETGYVLEPKFDGLRCVIVVRDPHWNKPVAYSRNGKPFWNIDHILEEVQSISKDQHYRDYVLDGELFTTDWNLSMGIVKSSKTVHADALKVQFHVWDYLPLCAWESGSYEASWRSRNLAIGALLLYQHAKYIHQVPGETVYNLAEAQACYDRYLLKGFEGGVLKDPKSPYNLGSRSSFWLKWKDWTDADLRIVGAVEGIGKRLGKIGALQLEGKVEWRDKSYDVVTEVGSFRCTDEQLTEMWERHKRGELVGLTAEIRFQDITVEGACRFPTFYRLREDKDVDPLDGGAAKKKRAKKVKPIILGDPELTDDYFDSLGGDSIIV
jgi:ATP-dependent DNA ligase